MSTPITLTPPDGQRRSFPGPVTVAAVAQSLGAGLSRNKVDGKLVDTGDLVDHGATMQIITQGTERA